MANTSGAFADLDDLRARIFPFPHRHFLSAADLNAPQATALLDLADGFVSLSRQASKTTDLLKGRTLMNLFFENSTRTQSSFELAGKRLGADVINMSARQSSMAKGETLIDTAVTLNAMQPDLLVVRHSASGAAALLSQKVDAAVINAGDGRHEHPTQALLDALSIRRAFGHVDGLTVAIVGDIAHSRVARSNAIALTKMGALVRLCAPHTLMPRGIEHIGGKITADRVRVTHRLEDALDGADVVMMLRVQNERTQGEAPRFPNPREFSRYWGLAPRTLALAKSDAIVLHPGPINRGVEVTPQIADGEQSRILDQVSWGVAVRMAVLHLLCGGDAEEIA